MRPWAIYQAKLLKAAGGGWGTETGQASSGSTRPVTPSHSLKSQCSHRERGEAPAAAWSPAMQSFQSTLQGLPAKHRRSTRVSVLAWTPNWYVHLSTHPPAYKDPILGTSGTTSLRASHPTCHLLSARDHSYWGRLRPVSSSHTPLLTHQQILRGPPLKQIWNSTLCRLHWDHHRPSESSPPSQAASDPAHDSPSGPHEAASVRHGVARRPCQNA